MRSCFNLFVTRAKLEAKVELILSGRDVEWTNRAALCRGDVTFGTAVGKEARSTLGKGELPTQEPIVRDLFDLLPAEVDVSELFSS